MIVVFDKAIKERELLLNNQISHENKEKIIVVDLRISMCIKKRARLTLGGYSYLPEKMYDWEPYYEIDRKLLPKTAS
jgi:activator of HSP90 ATPase